MKTHRQMPHSIVTNRAPNTAMTLTLWLALCAPLQDAAGAEADIQQKNLQPLKPVPKLQLKDQLNNKRHRQRAVSASDFESLTADRPASDASRANVAPQSQKPATRKLVPAGKAVPVKPIKIPTRTMPKSKSDQEYKKELLWREYPTDQRGSRFRQSWDSSKTQTDDKQIESSKEPEK